MYKITFKEFLTEKDFDTKLEYHDTLNPALWDDMKLKPDVASALLKIADKFKEFIDENTFRIVDIILTGSNCNYNWVKGLSDIDLHLVVDTSKLKDCPLTEPFLLAKKSLWNSGHEITVKGFPVELYAQDTDDKLAATGIYSLMKSKWVIIPKHQELSIDNFSVKSKAKDLMDQIDEIVKTKVDDMDVIKDLKDKIKKMRKAGLASGGEFSVENLAFKTLRNNGYLDKLSNYEKALDDKSLSLD